MLTTGRTQLFFASSAFANAGLLTITGLLLLIPDRWVHRS